MTILFSDDWLGRAVATDPNGAPFNNALGGVGSTTVQRTSAAHFLRTATTSGLLEPQNPTGNFIGGVIGDAGVSDGKVRMLIERSAGRSNVALRLAAIAPTTGSYVQIQLTLDHTRLRLAIGNNSSPQWTISAPAGDFILEGEIVDESAVVRIFNASDNSLFYSNTATLAGRPRGTFWGGMYSSATTPILGKLGYIVMDDMATGATPPTISSVTAAKDGKYAATGVITANGADGHVFYKWYPAADTPTMAEVLSTGTRTAWSASGAFPVSTSGLTAGTSYKLAAVRRDAGLNKSTLVVSSSFTTDPAFAIPAGSTSRVVSGQQVTLTYTPTGGPVSSVSMSLPVASVSPGGAVAQGPFLASLVGTDWVYVFNGVPAGSYDDPVTLASNADHASISMTGATGFSIVGMDGGPTAPDVDPPAEALPVQPPATGGVAAWRRSLLLQLAG